MSLKFSEEAIKNLTDLDLLLGIFRGRKLIGHDFNEDYTELNLHFEGFTFTINLKDAKWDVIENMLVFVSPTIEEIPWV